MPHTLGHQGDFLPTQEKFREDFMTARSVSSMLIATLVERHSKPAAAVQLDAARRISFLHPKWWR